MKLDAYRYLEYGDGQRRGQVDQREFVHGR